MAHIGVNAVGSACLLLFIGLSLLPAREMLLGTRDGPGEELEADVWRSETKQDGLGVMIAHPHPKFGGNMRNNVVKALFDALVASKKLRVVARFNFRGVGRSSGSSSLTGTSERQDIRTVAKVVSQDGDGDSEKPLPFIIIGYSFGSAVGCGMAEELREMGCVGFVAVSYPVGWASSLLFRSHYPRAAGSSLPKLFLMGTSDNFTWISTFRSWYAKVSEPKEMVVRDDMDHFWFGQEQWLVEHIQEWLDRIILPSI